MPKTNYLSEKILNHLTGTEEMSSPGPLYISLHTDLPGKEGSLTSELTGNGYTRVTVISWAAPSRNSRKNGTDIVFQKATEEWKDISCFGINDSITGGNMLYYEVMNSPVTVPKDKRLEFLAGSLSITEE